MKVTRFDIDGPLLIENKIFPDDRGFFTERYRKDLFQELGLQVTFVQDNFSTSKPGVLRGLHYQFSPAQGKLVTCVAGRIFDVAVDIRQNSPTLGKWLSVELDAASPNWLWVPAGFAHGFYAMRDQPASVMYKVDCYWAAGGESGLAWNDKDLAIEWPQGPKILSQKDEVLPSFSEYLKAPRFK